MRGRAGSALGLSALALAGILAAGCNSTPKPGTADAEAAVGHKETPGDAKAKQGLNGEFTLESVKGEELMPHTIGSEWTYSMDISRTDASGRTGRDKLELKYRITGARKEGDKTRFQLATYRDDKRIDEQIWYVDKTGFYQMTLGTAAKPFTPPQPVIKFPPKIGEAFTWSGSSPTSSAIRNSGKLEGKVVGIQPVDTELGTTTAIFVESVSVFDLSKKLKGAVVTDTFFRPNVGIVRYQQTTQAPNGKSQITLRLKEYTVK